MRLRLILYAILAQMAFALAAGLAVGMFFPLVAYVGMVVSVLVFFSIVKNNMPSAYANIWIMLILLIPSLGGALYLMIGNKRPTKKIAAYMKEHDLIAKLLDGDGNLPFMNEIECSRMYGLFHYVRQESSFHAYKNTQAKYYPLGEEMFADMIPALESAERFIFMEYFIIHAGQMWDTILEILERKAAQGVEVRLIVDDLGSQRLFTTKYIAELRRKNIKVLRFNPMVPFLLFFMNNRDHRKILVIDGHTGFSGGINIGDEYINVKKRFGIWKDTGLRLQGDGVWSYTLMFAEMWDTFCRQEERINDYEQYRMQNSPVVAETEGFVLPYGDTPLDREQLCENIYADILAQAKEYVYIFTPYLIPSETMINALQIAAKRGVDVRIVTPGIPDKKIIYRLTRSYYRFLINAGVKIYEYTPGFLHGKSIVSDDKTAVVGTVNLDFRSLYLHFECAALLYQCPAIADIKKDALEAIEQSMLVDLSDRKRRIFNDFLDAVLHLFAPLM